MLWPYHIFSWPKAYLDSSEATRWQNYEASWVLATKVLDGWQICQRSQTLILCVWLFLALMGRRRWEAWFLGPEAGVPVAGGWRSASEGSGGLREADWAFVGEEEEGGSGQGGLHYWAAATSTTLSYQGTIPLSPQTRAQSYYPLNTWKQPFSEEKYRHHLTLGGSGGQTVDTRSTFGVPLKTSGYNGSN